MCGILITKQNNILQGIKNQENRGLDSVGIINEDSIYKVIREDYEGYKKYIKENVIDGGGHLQIVHHRKASVGAINIENAHPFEGKHFVLIQNGTAKDFQSKTKYNKDVDSHNLLEFIEENTNKIEEIPDIMELFLEEYRDDFGIVIVIDYTGKILFLSDGARESYIKIKNDKVEFIGNYKNGKTEGWKNIGWMLFTFEGEIINKSFDGKLNSTPFNERINIYTPAIISKPNNKNPLIYRDNPYFIEVRQALPIRLENIFKWEISYDYETCLERFLLDTYEVNTVIQFFYKYNATFPIFVFKEIFDRIKKETDDVNTIRDMYDL